MVDMSKNFKPMFAALVPETITHGRSELTVLVERDRAVTSTPVIHWAGRFIPATVEISHYGHQYESFGPLFLKPDFKRAKKLGL